MKTFNYTFTHEDGSGSGTIQANSLEDSRKKLNEIYTSTESGNELPKGLEFDIKEVEPASEA
jgi:hypothetical protein